jgi:hypothetical protein
MGRIARALRATHWSEPPGPWEAVETGNGTRLEQPGPEQGVGRFGPRSFSGSRAKSSAIAEDESPTMSASSRLKSTSRSAREETR